jgi:hypothetical protein
MKLSNSVLSKFNRHSPKVYTCYLLTHTGAIPLGHVISPKLPAEEALPASYITMHVMQPNKKYRTFPTECAVVVKPRYLYNSSSITNSKREDFSESSLTKLHGVISKTRGTRWRSLLRHCATNRKVAGSISDGVNGSFHWHNPFGPTQPLTEMSTRNISWGVKVAGALGWQPYNLHVPTV